MKLTRRNPVLDFASKTRAHWPFTILLIVIFTVIALAVRDSLLRSNRLEHQQIQAESVAKEAESIKDRLESELASTFYLVTGLATFVGANPDLKQEDFDRYAKAVIEAKPSLVNIAAAPDLVINYVYPLEGNEPALGLDYNKHPVQREGVMEVKRKGSPIIAGPLELVQGGTAVIGRFPVYHESEFWGIISTPVLLERLLADAGIDAEDRSIEVALRGRDGKGAEGAIFYGESSVFAEEHLSLSVRLVSGAWQIGARPKEGWLESAPGRWGINAAVGAVYVLVIFVVILTNRYVVRLDQSRRIEASVSEAKSRFLATVSHEVRTPLNGICGIAQVLEMSELDDEQQEMVSSIMKSSVHLTDLLTDMLTLTQLSGGKFVSRSEEVDVVECLDSVVPLFADEARSKGVAFNFSPLPKSLRRIEIDPLVLRQVLWSTLSNAVKFTKEGSVDIELFARLDAEKRSNLICIRIKDTGIGIERRKQKVIFKEFVQEDDSLTRSYEGAGLGLAIAKQLIEAVGGTITLASEKGVGSEFLVELPYRELGADALSQEAGTGSSRLGPVQT